MVSIVDFGMTPLADALVSSSQLSKPQITAPLELVFCEYCSLMQINETVAPEILFGSDYLYYSSVSPSLLSHFRTSAEHIVETRNLTPKSLVMEAASNDGYMLQNFREHGIPVLGIDPAPGPSQAASARGIPTLKEFFSKDLAKRLLSEGIKADVFLANNVLAHVSDLNGFVEGIQTILTDEGLAVIEVPYLVDLVQKCEFDTIYHQHLCYFSVSALMPLFERHHLHLNDAMRTEIHGGSLRLFISRENVPTERLQTLLAQEDADGLKQLSYYEDFAERVAEVRASLRQMLANLKGDGKRIAGYAAAAKATTLMSYCGIDRTQIDYIVDLNEHKQGRYMPGDPILICSPKKLLEDKPDYLLVLAWNFSREIMAQQSSYREQGGKFIIPIPAPAIV